MFFAQEHLPTIQVFALFLIVVFAARLRLQGERIPRAILLFALVVACGAFGAGYSTKTLHEKRLVISRFHDDPLGTDSRIFRERLDKYLGNLSALQVVRFPDSFDSLRAVRKKFPNSRLYDAILWGRKDSFTVIFPNQSQPIERDERYFGFSLPAQMAPIGLSRSGDSGTIGFLGDLFAATLVPEHEGAMTEARRDILLENALKIESRWRSRSHRAVPAWLLGVRALERSVEGGDFQPGEMACALNHFSYAARLVSAAADAQLASNIYNSWGVALAIESLYSGDRATRKSAEEQFLRATALGDRGAFGRGAQAARYNLGVLKGRRSIKPAGDRKKTPHQKNHSERRTKKPSAKKSLAK